ncbi:hypothetical protein OUZ56_021266 [Daphnia magna]|uniref:Uncharacterized protein n=1 Tax=Daphnia magna TaxID=35525 RepID=A0ABQ9ZGW7_9CRUS|nr:hypothetical protein OUZ56_021266 [Daphnia magna]
MEKKFASLNQENPLEVAGQSLLTRMMRQAVKQFGKKPKELRHDDVVLEHFCINVWILGGRRIYEIFHSNFIGIFPSPSTIQDRLRTFDLPSQDGINFSAVVEYLKTNNAPNRRAIGGCNWSSRMPPLKDNGFPDLDVFIARTTEDIVKQFNQYDRASLVMIGMIQPLLDGLSPLRLFSFGTNSKYTSIDVNNRLNFVALKLKAFEIEVAAYSADGDSREMKVMRNRIRLGASIPPSPQASSDVHSSHPSHSTEHPTGLSISDPHSLRRSFPFFVCDFLPSCIIFFQDVTHLGAKLRTRLNKTQKSIPLGNFIATTAHIVALQEIIGKDRHGLRVGDVLLEDKMNYDAVRRLSKPHVRELLSQYVPKSEGTCFYLELMDNSTSSYLDKKLSPLDRVYRMWKSVFELRYWRYWMSCDNVYPLGNHFITLNAYLCVEINAHALVMLITKLRDTPQLFKPWLFSSQPCESYFKACRSFTPVGSTQLNFTLLDFIYSRCKKVDVALRLTALGHSDNIVYPRHVKNLERYGGSEESFVCNILPSTDEIRVTMDRARIDAKAALMKLGVDVADPDDRVFAFAFDSRLAAKLNEPLENPAPKEDDVNEFDECEELEDEGNDPLDRNVLDEYEQSLLNVISEGQLNDYSSLLEKCVLRNENSPRPHNDPENK